MYTDDSGNVNNFISEVFVCLRSSFNSFIGAGSVEVSVCPEYPVLTRVFCICSSARPSSTSSCCSVERGVELHMAELLHFWVSSDSGLVTASLAPNTDRTGKYNYIWK